MRHRRALRPGSGRPVARYSAQVSPARNGCPNARWQVLHRQEEEIGCAEQIQRLLVRFTRSVQPRAPVNPQPARGRPPKAHRRDGSRGAVPARDPPAGAGRPLRGGSSASALRKSTPGNCSHQEPPHGCEHFGDAAQTLRMEVPRMDDSEDVWVTVRRGAARNRPSRNPFGITTIGLLSNSGTPHERETPLPACSLRWPLRFGGRRDLPDCEAAVSSRGVDHHLVERPRVAQVGDPR